MKHTKFTTVREGLTISGNIYAEDFDTKRPAFILSHGFMANQATVKDYAKVIAECGYVAVTFDFCGGGLMSKSQGRHQDMSVLTEMKDLEAVIEYVHGLEYTTGEISLLGCSQGGFVSAMVAAKLGYGDISSLILVYPALCIPDDARRGHMMWAHFDPQNIPETIMCGPMKLGSCYVKAVIDMDPYERIEGYDGPVLYLHGTADEIVNISYAREAVKHYRKVSYFELEGAGHGFSGRAEAEAREKIAEFVRKPIRP